MPPQNKNSKQYNLKYLPTGGFPQYPNIASNDECEREIDKKLFKAVEAEDVRSVESLLKQGANPEMFFVSITCVLHTAILLDGPGVAFTLTKMLLDAGASANLLSPLHQTPLGEAVTCTVDVRIVRLLIERGANVDHLLNNGVRALHVAAVRADGDLFGDNKSFEDSIRNGRAIFELLIEKGADINMLTENHESPLHYAASVGCLYAVQRLLALGADPIIKTTKGKTALDLCMKALISHQNQECVNVLQEATEKALAAVGIFRGPPGGKVCPANERKKATKKDVKKTVVAGKKMMSKKPAPKKQAKKAAKKPQAKKATKKTTKKSK